LNACSSMRELGSHSFNSSISITSTPSVSKRLVNRRMSSLNAMMRSADVSLSSWALMVSAEIAIVVLARALSLALRGTREGDA
jgi:hypothetical protein